MKWSVVGLLLLGVTAAVCAAVLVGSLRSSMRSSDATKEQALGNVEVIVAAKALPALTLVAADSILSKTVPKDKLSAGSYSRPEGVLGKVLSRPMVEGQTFTAKCFATDGTGKQLAAMLPKGMRAVAVPLARHSGLQGLLYPGCVVDVLTSFKVLAQKDHTRQVISTVMIQGVQVIAIESDTIVSAEKDPNAPTSANRVGSGGRQNVTLMVSPQEAQALQLAVEHGSISLAMRSPLDTSPVRGDPTELTEWVKALLASLSEPRPPEPTPVGPVPPPRAGPYGPTTRPQPVVVQPVVKPPRNPNGPPSSSAAARPRKRSSRSRRKNDDEE